MPVEAHCDTVPIALAAATESSLWGRVQELAGREFKGEEGSCGFTSVTADIVAQWRAFAKALSVTLLQLRIR
jgi:hypothetical protein